MRVPKIKTRSRMMHKVSIRIIFLNRPPDFRGAGVFFVMVVSLRVIYVNFTEIDTVRFSAGIVS
jgi:hypothetical protein